MVGTATEFVIRFLSEFNQLRPYFYQAHNEVIAIRQLAIAVNLIYKSLQQASDNEIFCLF